MLELDTEPLLLREMLAVELEELEREAEALLLSWDTEGPGLSELPLLTEALTEALELWEAPGLLELPAEPLTAPPEAETLELLL